MMNNSILKKTEAAVWYREPYVWLLILFPFAAVGMGIIMITLALKSDDGLVVDDYYKKGLEINMDLARDRAAENFAITAELAVNPDGRTMRLTLDGNDTFISPETIQARFIHRTRSGLDQTVTMTRIADNFYTSPMPKLVSGNWKVLLESDSWRYYLEYQVNFL